MDVSSRTSPMPAGFASKKRRILEQLGAPDESYMDASPKGSVDIGVRELVNDINALDGFVTTSSCAGRIAVYQEGQIKDAQESPSNTASSTGKGGGSWLYVSHDALDTQQFTEPGALRELLGLPADSQQLEYPSEGRLACFIHFKYEPMHASIKLAMVRSKHIVRPSPYTSVDLSLTRPKILHILTSSLENAQHVLSAAMNAGFRESGISGVLAPSGSDQQAISTKTATPLVAVRTSGLAFDNIIASVSENHVRPMVTEECLRTLVSVANERFKVNAARKARFWEALQEGLAAAERRGAGLCKDHPPGWEPADERKARKRAEGLARQKALLRQQSPEEHEQVPEDFGSGLIEADALLNPSLAKSQQLA